MDPEMEGPFSSGISFDFTKIHEVISHKTEVFKIFVEKYKVEV
jgi:hypothetical protein